MKTGEDETTQNAEEGWHGGQQQRGQRDRKNHRDHRRADDGDPKACIQREEFRVVLKEFLRLHETDGTTIPQARKDERYQPG